MIESINPSTGETLKSYPVMSADEARRRIEFAHSAHREWRTSFFWERSERMKRVAELLQRDKEE